MKLNAVSLNADVPTAAIGVESISTDAGKHLPTNPFVGLRPFESNESFLFFGRDQQILKLLQRLQSRHFLAIVGSSGCGKSSLIRAGLIPKLKAGFLVERRDHWRIAIMKPGESPLRNLSTTVLELASGASTAEEVAAFTSELKVSGAQAAVRLLAEPLSEAEANILLVVDQFEELFRYEQPQIDTLVEGEDDADPLSKVEAQRTASAARELRRDEAATFVSTVLELARQREVPIYIVMTMRSDFLGDCDAFRGLPETINETIYLVPRLNRQQRIEAVEKPIKLYGHDITSRLLDLVVNDVGDESDQLPIMQHALMRTWEKCKENEADDKLVDLPDYEAAGMISTALSTDAERALSEIERDEQVIAKRMFQALVETDAQGRNVRRPARLTELARIGGVAPSKIFEIANHFRREGRCFLTLTSERVADDPLVDISHESLIRQWDQLSQWVRSENSSKDQYTRLASAAVRHSIDRGGLLTGTDLQLAIDWWEHRQPNEAWSLRYNREYHLAQRFLAESKAQRDKEKAEKERETIRIQKQNKKLRRMMYALGIISLTALLGVFGTAISTKRAIESLTEAQLARDEAQAARDLAERHSERALLESVRANREASSAQEQAVRADRARYQAERQTKRANAAAQLATARLSLVERTQKELELARRRNVESLIQQRRVLVDELGSNYQKALSLAGTRETIEQAVLTYEQILEVYEKERARGGELSTLLILGNVFDGTLGESDVQRALVYYERTLPLFNLQNDAERAKKASTLIKMGELLEREKRSQEAASRFEEAVALGYEPKLYELKNVYRKLAEFYEAWSDSEALKKSRSYYQRELSQVNERMKTSVNSTLALHKFTILIKLGTINMRLGDQVAAEQNYKDAEALGTGAVLELSAFDVLIRIGETFNRPGEKQQRDRFFQQAIHVASGMGLHADAHRMIGITLIDQKAYKEAIEYLTKAAEGFAKEDAKLAPVLRGIGTIYEQIGKTEDAIKYYTLAIALYEKLNNPATANTLRTRIQELMNKK